VIEEDLMNAPVGSRSDLEKAVAAMWVEALGVSEVQPDDDFFDLGGHSLIALDVIDQVQKLTGVGLQFADLQRARTVASLTDLIAREMTEAGEGRE
jgi:acyl carrier protein